MRRVFVFLLVLANQHSSAADFGGYVTLTTDYVRRGVSQSDGNPALQLGAEISFENGFFLGAWGSTVDIDSGPSRHRDVEVNYYAGYVVDVSQSLQFSVAAVAYDYPWQTGGVEYDYEEYSLGGNFVDRVWLEVAYSPDFFNTGHSSTNVDLFAEWPVNNIWSVGGGAGYYDTSNLTGTGYQYWQLGVTASLRWADVDFRFHDTDKWIPLVSDPDRAKSRVVLKIRIPF